MAPKKRNIPGSKEIPVAKPYAPPRSLPTARKTQPNSAAVPTPSAPQPTGPSALQTAGLVGAGVVLLLFAVLFGVFLSRSRKATTTDDVEATVVKRTEQNAPAFPRRIPHVEEQPPAPTPPKEQTPEITTPIIDPPKKSAEPSKPSTPPIPDDMKKKKPDNGTPKKPDDLIKTVKTTKQGDTTIIEKEGGGLKIKVVETTKKEKILKPLQSRLAVSRKHYDDMGKLLDELGEGYKYTQLDDFDLHNTKTLSKYDVVFLTCSTSGNSDKQFQSALRDYVMHGGTLYASDIRYDALAGAFPEYVVNPQRRPRNGGSGDVMAKVTDSGLRQILGPTMKLHFNLSSWRPASFKRQKVSVLLEGQYDTGLGTYGEAPLLVKFNCGKGTVIFTSFHNEAQNSQTEMKLLKHLVFTVVTAEIETKVTKTMISGGFSPQESRRIGISLEQPKVSAVYKNKKAGSLRFVLGFRDAGAKLQLTLTSPGGKKITHEGTSTFEVDVSDAPAGDWHYTITALTVPYRNFPFTLTVGQAKKAKEGK